MSLVFPKGLKGHLNITYYIIFFWFLYFAKAFNFLHKILVQLGQYDSTNILITFNWPFSLSIFQHHPNRELYFYWIFQIYIMINFISFPCYPLYKNSTNYIKYNFKFSVEFVKVYYLPPHSVLFQEFFNLPYILWLKKE